MRTSLQRLFARKVRPGLAPVLGNKISLQDKLAMNKKVRLDELDDGLRSDDEEDGLEKAD